MKMNSEVLKHAKPLSDFSFTPVEWGKKGGEVVKIIGRSICFRCESHASFIMGISMCRYYIFFRGLF